jgi:uncharacterized OB-fold protein
MPETATGKPDLTVCVLECRDCGARDPGPRQICRSCHGDNLVPTRVPGDGSLVSWTIIRRPPTAFREDGEYAVAVVELDAGVQVTGRLVTTTADTAPGDRVLVVGEKGGVPVFGFTP